MAFRGSPSPFGGISQNQGQVQTQTGPDLEEIQTEVDHPTMVLNIEADSRLAGARIPSYSRRGEIAPPTYTMAHRLSPSSYIFITFYRVEQGSGSGRWSRIRDSR